MNSQLNISVVVPVFNSAVCLEELVVRTSKVMHEINKTFEIILVDDGSKDTSWEVIKQLKAQHPTVLKGIRLAKNYGQQNATLCGIEHAQGDWVITMDDDLEYPPEEIPHLFAKQQEGDYDVVYGAYSKKKNIVRTFLAIVYKKIDASINHREYFTSSLRLIRHEIVKKICYHRSPFPLLDDYLSWYTRKISGIKINCQKSRKTQSGYRFIDLYRIVKNETLRNSQRKLRLIRFIGGAMASINFFLGTIIIYRKLLLSIHVQGYTSLIVSILFSSGLIIYGIGIIAENINMMVKMNYEKPVYQEKEQI